MRLRDLDRLAEGRYDMLVIGGGIHGLAAAYEAASRGLSVALVDAGDFGGGASFNQQKTAHGGLRALQSGRIVRARQGIYERRALARIAPWLLRPLPFIVGTYRSPTRNRLTIRAAFKIDELLGRKRNDGVEPELHLPKPRLVSKAATLRLFPGIRPDRLTGGAQWYDYQMIESDRLTLAFAAAADAAGADLASYVEAIGVLKEAGRVSGMTMRDRLTGRQFPVAARAVINAAGAHAGVLMERLGVRREFRLLKAMNLVTSKRASDIALAAPTPSGRMLTLVPWQGRALVGTSQSSTFAEPDDVNVSESEVTQFIAEANGAFPALNLRAADVTLVHRGVIPAIAGRNGMPELRPEPAILEHARDGAEGAFTIVGVKYTFARALAERTANLVAKRLGTRLTPSRTATTVLPGAGIADHEALAIETARTASLELPLPVIRHLIGRYAEAAARIVRLMAEKPELQTRLDPETSTCGAEVVHVIRHEMAVRLTDIVIRRTGLGAALRPSAEAIRTTARIAAAECGWDAQRVDDEIRQVEEFYELRP